MGEGVATSTCGSASVKTCPEAEAQFRALFVDNTAVKLLIDPADGRIVAANPAACAYYGHAEAELTAMRVQDLNQLPEAEVRAQMASAVARTAKRFEFLHRLADGRVRHVEVDSAPFPFRGQQVLLSIVHDVDDRVRAAEERERARVLAEAASDAKSSFLANMSHEIRTPLTAILGYAEELDEQALDPAQQQEAIRTIRDNADHLLGVVGAILDLASIETGAVELLPEIVSLERLLEGVGKLFSLRAKAKGVALDLTLDASCPAHVRVDATRLRQVLINLVNNALKFTEAGRVRIAARMQGDRLEVAVEDTGIGMSDAETARLFQPFTQARAEIHRRYGGSGLGLSIARRLCRLMGGDLTVRSEAGRGSVFIATVSVEAAEPRPPRAPLPTLPRARLLLAEDVPTNQRLVAGMLERAGASVHVVGDGQDAVEAAERACAEGRPFDAILMDIEMPRLGGIAATEALRRGGHRTPIFALTANVLERDRARYRQAGCDGCFGKPVRRAELLGALAAALRPAAVTSGA